MIKRRSLDDALITPEEQAFLATGIAAPEKFIAAEAAKPSASPPPAKPEPEISQPELPSREIQKPAEAGLGALTVRMQPTIMAALLRASLERKIQRIEPFTQRDIVSVAVAYWLKANGYA